MGILNWLNWLKGIFGRRGAPMLPPPGSGVEGGAPASEKENVPTPQGDASKAEPAAADGAQATPEAPPEDKRPMPDKAPDPRLSKSKEELCEELDKANDTIGKLKLAYADVLNDQKSFQKRLQKEKERAIGEGVCRVTRDLLDISDELERALAAVQDDKGPLAEGVRMVHGSMRTRLEKLGVTRMELTGTYFDPNKAEAMDVVPVDTQDKDGVVIQELRPGFMLNGTVLREARVSVGKWIPPAPPPAPAPEEAPKEEAAASQGDAEAPADADASAASSTASEGSSAPAAPSGETAPEAAAPSSEKAVDAATSTEVASSDAKPAPTSADSAPAEADASAPADVKAEAAAEGKPA